jgi:hypothetical protein
MAAHAAGGSHHGDGEDRRCIAGLVASRGEGRNTAPVADRELQGWYRDPFGTHELRHYSAGRPTRLVRDGGHEFYEEPTSDGAPQSRPPDSAANWDRRNPSAGYGGGTGRVGPQPGAYDGQPGPHVGRQYGGRPGAYGSELGAYAGQPYGGRQAAYGHQPGQYGPEPGGSLQPQLSHRRSHRHAHGGPRRSAKKRGVALAAVAVAVVGAIVAVVALRGNGGNGGSLRLTPVAFVSKAASQTLAQKTADVTLSGTIQASGKTAAVHGTGQLDLAGKAVSLNLSASVPGGGAFNEHEIVSGGTVYLQLVVEGRNIFKAATGKPWLAIPIGRALQSGSTSAADSNPASSLAILQQKGAKVTTLGSRSINGHSCDGYQVTPTRQAMITSAKQEWAKVGLSKAQTSTALHQLRNLTPPTMTVWFNPQRQLACQMDVGMQMGGLSSGSASAHMTMTFTNYGAPVHISPPTASDTASPQQLAKSGH